VGRSVATKAGESGLIVGVQGRVLLTATASTPEVTAEVTTGGTAGSTARGTTGSAATTATASVTTGTAAATAATATALGLSVPSDVNIQELLLLSLPLALGLALPGSKELLLLLFLGERGKTFPLVVLHALVGLADLQGGLGFEGQFLLGLLSQVLVKRDVLVLGLFRDSFARGLSIFLLGLGDLFASLLILELRLAFFGSPSLGSLLFGVAATGDVNNNPRTGRSRDGAY
jgi:hypothetical protein